MDSRLLQMVDEFEPRIPNAREKYPRDAVIEWYHENWRRTAI